ncbi:MAG: biotin/lipoyl-containing protein, partial [bacterium]
MSVNVLMPALSPTMTEGKIARWLKAEGDAIKSGQVLCEIETDKATMEVEAVDEGRLAKILVPAGTEGVKVNTPIAVIAGEGEETAVTVSAPPVVPAAPAIVASVPAPVSAAAPAAERSYDRHVSLTVREALRDAMAEEMRRDPAVFLMGEEVAQYQG